MSIFGYFRYRNRQLAALKPGPFYPWPVEVEAGNTPHASPATIRIFEATHMHVRTGKLYMLTGEGERLEVTGDDAYPLAEYEDAEGNLFAQRLDRFNDGRFLEFEELPA